MTTDATTVPAVPLTPDMRRALEKAGNAVKAQTRERDRLIKDALAEGGSLREIAAAVGLSHTAVKLIGGRDPAER